MNPNRFIFTIKPSVWVKQDLMLIGIITFGMLLSWMLALGKLFILSGIILIILALALFVVYFKKTKNFLNSRGVYSLFWIISVGLSAMKFHPLQVQWKPTTWICIWLSVCTFLIGYDIAIYVKKRKLCMKGIHMDEFTAICGLSSIILLVFFLEVAASGSIPLFSSNMEAYQSFALPFLHYITVSSVLIAPITIMYLYTHKCSKQKKCALFLINLIMISIPVLIVSRQLLIMNLIFIFFTILEMRDTSHFPLKYVIIFAVVLIIGWIILSQSRNQSDAYIKYVFKLDDKMSVPLYQAYMYIAFNIDNFNDVVGKVNGYSVFRGMLGPLLTFTGTKGIAEKLFIVSMPDRLLPVYNTYGFLLTPYKDLRSFGVVIYCLVIGYFTGHVEKSVTVSKTPKNVLDHVIVNYVLIFSFFSAFFSNTSIWGYFIIVFAYDSFTSYNRKKQRRL